MSLLLLTLIYFLFVEELLSMLISVYMFNCDTITAPPTQPQKDKGPGMKALSSGWGCQPVAVRHCSVPHCL